MNLPKTIAGTIKDCIFVKKLFLFLHNHLINYKFYETIS